MKTGTRNLKKELKCFLNKNKTLLWLKNYLNKTFLLVIRIITRRTEEEPDVACKMQSARTVSEKLPDYLKYVP